MAGIARRLLPLADRVLVKKMVPKTQTAGGIFLPESNAQKNNEAEVVAVGPGGKDKDGKLMPMSVSVGDSILLPEYGASLVKLGDEEFHLIKDMDILGKFE